MKSIFQAFCGLLVGILSLTSCLGGGNDSYAYYDDMAIKTFTLGTLNRYLHTTTAQGTDSVYKTTYAATSVYKMSIDQMKHRIFNNDSLPTGTDAAHVICNVTTVNNGYVYVKSLTSDTLYYFNSGSDSIDFTQPRIFRVYATDGSGSRDYTVSLNIRNYDKGLFQWVKADKSDFPEAEDSLERKAAEENGLHYLGRNAYEAYAMSPSGLILESEDEGETWKEDMIDSDNGLLPQTALAYTSWYLDYKTDYALLVGALSASDKAMTIWRKLVDDDMDGRWAYMPLDEGNPYYLPLTDHVELVRYGEAVLAFCSNKKVYQSRDQGITWKETSLYALPESFTASTFRVAVDEDSYLWLTDAEGEQTFKGILTR